MTKIECDAEVMEKLEEKKPREELSGELNRLLGEAKRKKVAREVV